MSGQPENPPAFPCVVPDQGFQFADHGMTLRDWFAGQALPAALAAMARHPSRNDEESLRLAAVGAYVIADAMLAERSKA